MQEKTQTTQTKPEPILRANVHDLVAILKAEVPLRDYVLWVGDNDYNSSIKNASNPEHSSEYSRLTEFPGKENLFVYASSHGSEGIVWTSEFASSRQDIVRLINNFRLPIDVSGRPIAVMHHHQLNVPYLFDSIQDMEFFEFSHETSIISYACIANNNAHLLRLMLSRNMQEKYEGLVITPGEFTQDDAEYILGKGCNRESSHYHWALERLDLNSKPLADVLNGEAEQAFGYYGLTLNRKDLELAKKIQQGKKVDHVNDFYLGLIAQRLKPQGNPIPDPKRYLPEAHDSLIQGVT